jgi:hypothetical protein
MRVGTAHQRAIGVGQVGLPVWWWLIIWGFGRTSAPRFLCIISCLPGFIVGARRVRLSFSLSFSLGFQA